MSKTYLSWISRLVFAASNLCEGKVIECSFPSSQIYDKIFTWIPRLIACDNPRCHDVGTA